MDIEVMGYTAEQVETFDPAYQAMIKSQIDTMIAEDIAMREFHHDIAMAQQVLPKLTDYIYDGALLVLAMNHETKDVLGSVITRQVEINGVIVVGVGFMQVHEPHRRSGIGKLILEYVEGLTKSAGCKDVVLSVLGQNESAIKFYEEAGYSATQIVMAKTVNSGAQ